MTRKELTEILRESDYWEENGNSVVTEFESTESDVNLILEKTKLTVQVTEVFSVSMNYNEVDYSEETGNLMIRKRGCLWI